MTGAPADLVALIDEAERRGMWLWTRYHDLWFSPAQLRKENAQGRFRWGAPNWELRDPKERLAKAEEVAAQAIADVERIRAEMGR